MKGQDNLQNTTDKLNCQPSKLEFSIISGRLTFICESSFGHYVGFRPCSEAVSLSSSFSPLTVTPRDTPLFGVKGCVALNRAFYGFQGTSGLPLPKLPFERPPLPPPLHHYYQHRSKPHLDPVNMLTYLPLIDLPTLIQADLNFLFQLLKDAREKKASRDVSGQPLPASKH